MTPFSPCSSVHARVRFKKEGKQRRRLRWIACHRSQSEMNGGCAVLVMPVHPLVPQNAADPSVGRSALRILIVAVPPMRTLDVFGPSEVFGDANWLRGGAPAYEVNTISASADEWFRVISACGYRRIGRTENIVGRSIHFW
jgi:hypothetical protein